jgi:hypothetical protein
MYAVELRDYIQTAGSAVCVDCRAVLFRADHVNTEQPSAYGAEASDLV